jgi:dTDP-4-amino-4,6-dideoxygalactose transaminase
MPRALEQEFAAYRGCQVGAYVEAGICVTNDAAPAERIQRLRDRGSRNRYQLEVLGVNARLDEIQSCARLQQAGVATGVHYPTPIHCREYRV